MNIYIDKKFTGSNPCHDIIIIMIITVLTMKTSLEDETFRQWTHCQSNKYVLLRGSCFSIQKQTFCFEMERQRGYMSHDNAMIEKKCPGERTKKLKVTIDYNRTMGGVYLSDVCLVSYQSSRKSLKKYYQEHFPHMMDCCLNFYH